jgi:type VI protein secretion system component Hcp
MASKKSSKSKGLAKGQKIQPRKALTVAHSDLTISKVLDKSSPV